MCLGAQVLALAEWLLLEVISNETVPNVLAVVESRVALRSPEVLLYIHNCSNLLMINLENIIVIICLCVKFDCTLLNEIDECIWRGIRR